MKNKITTDDLINKLPADVAQQLRKEVEEEVQKIKWGGKRPNAGRKTKTGSPLIHVVKVSEKEKEFLNYARSNNIDYDKLMHA